MTEQLLQKNDEQVNETLYEEALKYTEEVIEEYIKIKEEQKSSNEKKK